MARNRLNRLQRLLSASAESFRGVGMCAYLALIRAAKEVRFAIEAAGQVKQKKRPGRCACQPGCELGHHKL